MVPSRVPAAIVLARWSFDVESWFRFWRLFFADGVVGLDGCWRALSGEAVADDEEGRAWPPRRGITEGENTQGLTVAVGLSGAFCSSSENDHSWAPVSARTATIPPWSVVNTIALAFAERGMSPPSAAVSAGDRSSTPSTTTGVPRKDVPETFRRHRDGRRRPTWVEFAPWLTAVGAEDSVVGIEAGGAPREEP